MYDTIRNNTIVKPRTKPYIALVEFNVVLFKLNPYGYTYINDVLCEPADLQACLYAIYGMFTHTRVPAVWKQVGEKVGGAQPPRRTTDKSKDH